MFQTVGWALAWTWQVLHFVLVEPPSKPGVPGSPWQAWQATRSFLASRPWKALLVASVQIAPRAWGAWASPWHRVLLKQPGAVPAEAGVAGWFAGLTEEPLKWHWAQTGALEGSVLAWFERAVCQGLPGCGALVV